MHVCVVYGGYCEVQIHCGAYVLLALSYCLFVVTKCMYIGIIFSCFMVVVQGCRSQYGYSSFGYSISHLVGLLHATYSRKTNVSYTQPCH